MAKAKDKLKAPAAGQIKITGLREKTKYDYIYVVPAKDDRPQQVRLLMPIVGEVSNISRDNTCKATTESVYFLGKCFNEEDRKKSAKSTLDRMKSDLQFDIAFLESNYPAQQDLIKSKRERLSQVQQHLGSVQYIMGSDNSIPTSAMQDYPISVRNVLNANNNCFSMVLAPKMEDTGQGKAKNVVFKVKRRDDAANPWTAPDLTSGLAYSLRQGFEPMPKMVAPDKNGDAGSAKDIVLKKVAELPGGGDEVMSESDKIVENISDVVDEVIGFLTQTIKEKFPAATNTKESLKADFYAAIKVANQDDVTWRIQFSSATKPVVLVS